MDDKKNEAVIEQLDKINNQICNIENRYPFIVTTIITVVGIISTILTNELEKADFNVIFNILVVSLPIITVLIMCYILQLFRQVALLRGYAAYLEEFINKWYNNSIMIWNSKYIDGFIENNSPNLLIILSSIIATISIVGCYINSFLLKAKIKLQYKSLISVIFIILLIIIAYQFSKNDKYRRLSYWKAKSENENIIRVFLYSECQRIIAKSGVGKAMTLQMRALQENDIYYTTKKQDFYNVVHINTFGIKSLFLAKKCKKKNKKIVITAHTIVEDFKNSFKFTYNKFIQKLFKKWIVAFYNYADIIIAPTQYVKDLLQSEKYNIEKPIKVISNGVDMEIFSNVDNKKDECRQKIIKFINKRKENKLKINYDDKIIISVGLYLERKGILNFIELAKIMPEYKFIWFGHTSNILIPREISKAIKNSKRLPNIYFPGYVEHSALSKAYKAADLYLMLSYEETEGLVVLEALASKVQTIINDINVYKDWLIDKVNCYKVVIDDKINEKSDIVNVIKKLLDNRIYKTTEEGYKIAIERDLQIIGKKLKEVYKSLNV